ncbi:MAG: hypothetical protein H0X33_00900 [Taibaiella sp.]|nr:hypothetical protein [Taibaiella sp.]
MYSKISIKYSKPHSIREGAKHGNEWKESIMRKLTYLILFSYTITMLKPVMPLIADAVAHTFWESKHILTVHEVHGKFHVHQELVQASHQSEKGKTSSSYKLEIAEYFEVTALITFKGFKHALLGNIFPSYSCYYPVSYLDMEYRPPKA